MSDLREAAQAVLDRWDGRWDWRDDGPTADLMKDLRAALAEPEQDGICKHCTESCPACDARKQTTPKPVCDECGKSKVEGWALYCVDCMEPVFGQRKPLTVAETNALIDSVDGLGIGRHVMHKVARAVEQAHGIGSKDE